ncbi:hypothetical protein [Archangium violaceum]|uniref:hypothetical protein n=1 Tax=Archangium violaceum TaxID=83451 RepID=UPI0036DD8FCB
MRAQRGEALVDAACTASSRGPRPIASTRSLISTPEEFEALLRQIYNRPEMRARFPDGL